MEITAWTAFFCTLPSALWRVLMILGALPGTADLRTFELADTPVLSTLYVVGLSVVQVGTGFLTVGLVRRWGQRLRGRSVPLIPVLVAAALGGLAVIWLFDISLPRALLAGQRPDGGRMSGSGLVVMIACYTPLLLWGPLVLATTVGYWRLRRGRRAQPHRAAP